MKPDLYIKRSGRGIILGNVVKTLIEILKTESKIHKFYLALLAMTFLFINLISIKVKLLGLSIWDSIIPLFVCLLMVLSLWAKKLIVKDRDSQNIVVKSQKNLCKPNKNQVL